MIAADASERGRILVVDDNSLNRALLTRVLEAEGFDVATAENGNRALELLRVPPAPPFDVVLLDVLMPERDGYSTLSAIKTDDDLRHLPVIMITAVDELASVVRCIELGATDYLSKPFNAAVLRARINASLSGKRLRDLELEYLEQVDRLTTAAADVEAAIAGGAIGGGMAPKVRAATAALASVPAVRITNLEGLENGGTRIVAEKG